MTRFRTRCAGLLAATVLLSGCTTLQNLSVDDLRKPDNLRRERELPLTLAQIQKALFDYRMACGPVETLDIDPTNPTFASIAIATMGLNQQNVGILLEFREDNGRTAVKAWAHYERWARFHADRILAAITQPKVCQ